MRQLVKRSLPTASGRLGVEESEVQKIAIPSRKKDLEIVRSEILGLMTSLKYSWPSVCAMRIALTEALNNALEHGNGNDPSKMILVSYQVDTESVWVAIEDEGEGFDSISSIANIPLRGQLRGDKQGLALIQRCCDEFGITAPGNRIELLKHNV